MTRTQILILDGDALKAQGLGAAMGPRNWEVSWKRSDEIPDLAHEGVSADLVLVDPSGSPDGGHHAVEILRKAKPALPVILIRESAIDSRGTGASFRLPIPNVAAFLDRNSPLHQWPAAMEPYLAPLATDKSKLTTEDIFGDILADLVTIPPQSPAPKPAPPAAAPAPVTSSPEPPAMSAPAPKVTPPAHLKAPIAAVPVVKPQVPLLQAPKIQRPIIPLGIKPSAPATALPPVIQAPIPAVIPPKPMPSPVEPAPSHIKPKEDKDECTLSGISGVNDPFEPDADLAQPPPRGESTHPRQPAAEIEFLGSAEQTPGHTPREVVGTPVVLPTIQEVTGSMEEFGNYYLLEKIAVGGMAELFKARQRGVHNFEKIVAIKRILPHLSDNDEFVRMFIDEAKLAAQLTHPNIVQIFDLGKASGFYYIAMEYVDGKDLRSLLRRVRDYRIPFPEPVAAFVAMKVAGALDYAHRKKGMNDKELKLVHRDISPQNVLISADGAVKLVDFGIAKAATKSTQTMAGALKGKLLYMSPEQALGQPLDSRSDIYSLGLVLFELLTGERCFQADSELGVLEKVRLGKVSDVLSVNPAVTTGMVNILERALKKDVDKRYASARLLERDLKGLLVKHGNEPAEHDVAEYVNTLLKGSKEQLESLIAAHFPPQAKKTQPSGAIPPVAIPPKSGETATLVEPRKQGHVELPPPPTSNIEKDPPARSPWLIPGISAAILILAATLWFFLR